MRLRAVDVDGAGERVGRRRRRRRRAGRVLDLVIAAGRDERARQQQIARNFRCIPTPSPV